MPLKAPPALEAVFQHIRTQAPRGTYVLGQRWPKFSEEWYWEQLVDKQPFRSVYEEDPGAAQPLIWARPRNLSQTPREQCERMGLVQEGLERGGPGQEVVLQGLKSCPELNGCRGRVLPLSGAGAPTTKVTAGRVPVRLADGGREVAVRPENLRSPHAAAAGNGATAAAATAGAAGAAAAAQPPGSQQQRQGQERQQQQGSKADMLRLLEAEFRLWTTGATLTATNLRQGGMREQHTRCCSCGAAGDQPGRYVALKRTAPLRAAPLPDSVLRLLCVDCYAEAAVAAGVPMTADGVEEFVDDSMMGAMEACHQLLGFARVQWGGENFGSGALY